MTTHLSGLDLLAWLWLSRSSWLPQPLATAQVRVATLDELRRSVEPWRRSLSRPRCRGIGQRAVAPARGHRSRHPSRDPGAFRTAASPGHHDPAQRHPVARAASRPFAERRPHRRSCRRGVCRRDVRVRRCGRPQRDRRVGADLSGIRGPVHRNWRTGGLGGRFRELETARQVRQALHGGDHGESDASAVAETGPGGSGVLLKSAEPMLK